MATSRLTTVAAICLSPFSLLHGQLDDRQLGPSNIRTVPSDTLADLAVAHADHAGPVIYFNPRLLARFSPDIVAFVLAHEEAHVELGHVRPASGVAAHESEQALQRMELEADCRAAERLAQERPAALQAAVGFFERMGVQRSDGEHPTGNVRAETLRECGGKQNGDPRRTVDPQSVRGGGWLR